MVVTSLDVGTARARAESLMTSTCTVGPDDATPVTDPVTGKVTWTSGPPVYSGKCRVRPGTVNTASTDEAGGAEIFVFGYQVSIPFAAVGVKEGHHVVVTASPDPDLIGIKVKVQKVARGEHITARRLMCTEVA